MHSGRAALTPPEKAVPSGGAELYLGDLPGLRKRALVRVLVSDSPTRIFSQGDTPKGLEYELLQHYEEFLSRDLPPGKPRTHVVFIPMPLGRVLDALREGRGDIAAAGITITPQRLLRVAFTRPYISGVRELLVQRRDGPSPRNLQDLSGRQVDLVAGTSALEYLQFQNRRLRLHGQPPIRINTLNEHLVAEDVLELINAGMLDLSVVSEHTADAWCKALPNLVVRKDLVVHEGGDIAWAVRKDSPLLRESLDSYLSDHGKDSRLGNLLVRRYYSGRSVPATAAREPGRGRLEQVAPLLKRYAKRYGFDWLAIAALAYQESGLDQTKVSTSGAQGIMQIMPETAASLGPAGDIADLEGNVRAGVKYLARLRDRYFDDPELESSARAPFLWAAYNAGPKRISDLREQATREGLDPNHWFGQVERIAARELGRQTVDHVAQVNKYYLAYRLHFEALGRRQQVRTRQIMAALPASWLPRDTEPGGGPHLD